MQDSTNTIRILHVDDDPDFAEVAALSIERQEETLTVETATSAGEGLEKLEAERFDCIVSDYEMPGQDGIEFLRTVRDEYPGIPFILFTGKGSEAVASEAISAGVTDYLQKEVGTEQYELLVNRITNVVEASRSKELLEQRTKRLETLISNLPGMVYRCRNERAWPMENVAGEVESLTGYPATELENDEGLWGQEVIHPDDRSRTWEEIQEGLSEDGTFEVTYRIRTRDGATKWVWERGRGVYGDNRELEALEGFISDITRRKERERELRRYERMINTMQESACVYDEDGNFEVVNEHLAAFYETDREDLEGEPSNLLPKIQEQREGDPYEELLAGERDEIRGVVAGTFPGHGHEVLEYRLTPLVVDGEIEGAVSVTREVTDRVESERELEETNTLLSTLIETLPVGVLAEDENRNVLAVNDRMFELFELPGGPDDVVGADCEQMAEAVSGMFADADAFVDEINRIVDTQEQVLDEELDLADGRTFVRSYKPVELLDGDGHLWMYQDITESKQHVSTVADLHQVATELATCETEDEILERTVEAAESLLEFERAGIATEEDGRLRIEVMSDGIRMDDPPTMDLDEGIAGRTYQSGNSYIIDNIDDVEQARPQTGMCAAISVPIGDHGVFQVIDDREGAFDEQDRDLAELLVQHTETALTLLEREQELERQNDRLEEFTSVVSHDLRNPLNVASLRLELAQDECDSEHLDDVAQAHERIQALIEDLLTLARDGEEVRTYEPIDLADLTTQCLRNVETGDAIIETDVDMTISADSSRLQQLLENLVRNAIEHGNGNVRVEIGALDGGFYVEDDGPGIPPENRESVFDAGYSTTAGGTGFGLSIVKQVAEAHGWEITVTEGSEGGARFEITGVEKVQ